VNTTLIFTYIHKLIEVLKEYLVNLEDESVRDNFVIIYELLDEMMDNGYPQTTEVKILREFIKTEENIKK
jgi:AP-1 complex subunit mu